MNQFVYKCFKQLSENFMPVSELYLKVSSKFVQVKTTILSTIYKILLKSNDLNLKIIALTCQQL